MGGNFKGSRGLLMLLPCSYHWKTAILGADIRCLIPTLSPNLRAEIALKLNEFNQPQPCQAGRKHQVSATFGRRCTAYCFLV
jgi:hypothetical protein